MFHKVDIVVATAGNVGDAGQPAAAEDDAAGTCSERSGESNVCVADSARSEWAQSVAGEDLGGVFASDDIEEGEVLFRIPHSFVHPYLQHMRVNGASTVASACRDRDACTVACDQLNLRTWCLCQPYFFR